MNRAWTIFFDALHKHRPPTVLTPSGFVFYINGHLVDIHEFTPDPQPNSMGTRLKRWGFTIVAPVIDEFYAALNEPRMEVKQKVRFRTGNATFEGWTYLVHYHLEKQVGSVEQVVAQFVGTGPMEKL